METVVGRKTASAAGVPLPGLSLRDPAGRIPRLGAVRAARLAAEGIVTVGDFLLALPFRYEDRRRYGTVATLSEGEAATLRVQLRGVRATRMRRGSLRVEAVADDGTGAVRVVWHNRYPSFAEAAASGRALALYGGKEVTSNMERIFFIKSPSAPPWKSCKNASAPPSASARRPRRRWSGSRPGSACSESRQARR